MLTKDSFNQRSSGKPGDATQYTATQYIATQYTATQFTATQFTATQFTACWVWYDNQDS